MREENNTEDLAKKIWDEKEKRDARDTRKGCGCAIVALTILAVVITFVGYCL